MHMSRPANQAPIHDHQPGQHLQPTHHRDRATAKEFLDKMHLVAKHADLEDKKTWADLSEEQDLEDQLEKEQDVFHMLDGSRVTIQFADHNFKK